MVVQAQRNEVTGLVRTAVHTHGVLVHQAHTRHFVHPVRAATYITVNLRLRIAFLIGAPQLVEHLVLLRHEAFGIQELRSVLDGLEGHRTRVADFHLTLLTAFGRDKYHTARSVRTVDTGCRSVLEDIDALDIIGRDVNQGIVLIRAAVARTAGRCTALQLRYTVNHHKGFLTGQAATYTDGLTGSRGSTVGCNVHACRTSAQHLAYTGGGCLGQIVGFDHLHRTGDITFLRCAVTDNHHLFNQFGVRHKTDAHVLCTGKLLRDVTHVRHSNGLALVGSNLEVAVEVGDRTVGRSFHQHARADDRFTVLVKHYAADVGKSRDRYR